MNTDLRNRLGGNGLTRLVPIGIKMAFEWLKSASERGFRVSRLFLKQKLAEPAIDKEAAYGQLMAGSKPGNSIEIRLGTGAWGLVSSRWAARSVFSTI
jgi:hypothetical protein